MREREGRPFVSSGDAPMLRGVGRPEPSPEEPYLRFLRVQPPFLCQSEKNGGKKGIKTSLAGSYSTDESRVTGRQAGAEERDRSEGVRWDW